MTPTDPLEAAQLRSFIADHSYGADRVVLLASFDALLATPRPAGVDALASKALAAVVEWSRRYRGPFGYATQHDFTRERFDPIAREYAALDAPSEVNHE